MSINKAQKHLSKDSVLAKVISSYPPLDELVPVDDVFADLVESIISQQLSVKVADVILRRVRAKLPNDVISPQTILAVDQEELRACGMSYAKIRYVRSSADAALSGLVDFKKLQDKPNEEAVAELVQITGVGQWTAEMLLIFSLARPDVFSIGDLGLRSAVSKLYEVDREDRPAILAISEKWAPYRSLASRYLWKSLDNKPSVGQ